MMPSRVQRKRTKGYRLPLGARHEQLAEMLPVVDGTAEVRDNAASRILRSVRAAGVHVVRDQASEAEMTTAAARMVRPKPLLSFIVHGEAQSRGSKTAVPIRGGGMRTKDSNPKSGPWMQLVGQVARREFERSGHTELFGGPLVMRCTFYRVRPKSHFGAAGDLKRSAPAYPTGKPDAGKLMRAIEDALSKVVYGDDAQLVDPWPSKRYGDSAKVRIELFALPATMADQAAWLERQLALPLEG